jgi:nitrile hydratase accessory protein
VKVDVAALEGAGAPPRRNGELVFAAPWEGRAFGMALAVVERLGLDWSAFQRRLVAAIAEAPEAPYYACWTAALERLLVDHGVLSGADLDAATDRLS